MPARSQASLLAATLTAITLSAMPDQTVRLATIAPTGSPWHAALNDLATACERDTAGRVKVVVHPNGGLGAEVAVVRNMRLGQIQMSLLTLPGLSFIDRGFSAAGMPFFFENDAEAKTVLDTLTPLIETRLSAKGFHLLGWTLGGWVQLFSKASIKSLEDLKRAKLWTSDGDTAMVQWYKTNGFHPVALDPNSIAAQLKIGMIDATPSPAFPAMLLSLYKDAPFMLDVRVGPFLGAIVITKTAWTAMSADDQSKMTAAAKTFETRTSAEIPKLDPMAIGEMQKRGLTVTTLDKRAADEFRAAADKLVATMRGSMVPADMFDAAKAARDAFRRRARGAGGQ